MKLTKKEALEKMRDMWLWLEAESEKQKRKVQKYEYFSNFGFEIPENECYACEFDREQHREQHLRKNDDCSNCPLKESKDFFHYCFRKWYKSYDYQKAAELCQEIAKIAEYELRIKRSKYDWIKTRIK